MTPCNCTVTHPHGKFNEPHRHAGLILLSQSFRVCTRKFNQILPLSTPRFHTSTGGEEDPRKTHMGSGNETVMGAPSHRRSPPITPTRGRPRETSVPEERGFGLRSDAGIELEALKWSPSSLFFLFPSVRFVRTEMFLPLKP